MNNNLTWELVSEEHLIRDEWIDFRRCAFRLPDGTVFEPYYSYSRRSYVVIVACDEEDHFLCVRQFRQGIRQVTTEFPAGGIEREGGTQYANTADTNVSTGSSQTGTSSPLTLTEPALCPDTSEAALEAAKRELAEETGYVSDEWTHLLTVPSNATISDNYAHLFLAKKCRPVQEQHLDETEFLSVLKLSASEIEALIREGNFQQAVHVLAYELAKKHL